MIEFRPFHIGHLSYVRPLDVQTGEFRAGYDPTEVEAMYSGPALSAWAGGLCLGAAGINKPYQGRGECWALFRAEACPYMLSIVRKMRLVLDSEKLRRIDMMVRATNPRGHKLAACLGFVHEATLEAFHPTGDDVFIYKRVTA